VVEHLPSKHEALSQTTVPKRKEKKNKEKGKRKTSSACLITILIE
jgi:hypothetical protein